MSNLQHIKGSRTRVLNTFPTKTFGNDGDIVISRINGKGVFLCSKAGGMWYAANKMQELNKLEKTSIRDLTTNKLTVNRMINTEKSTDRFVVSDAGNLKYMTGEQVVGDLPLPVNNIDYKTAYCSLGQYSDKDTCESNGGTWYYSENDSHDSISSTAENQLLTVGQSIGGVDAEPTLIYDGSTLEIKYNSDYDDNWQTSATTDLLKLSYDSSEYTTFNVGSTGDLTLDCSGTLILDTETGVTKFTLAGDTDDLCTLTVAADGVTTIATADSDGAVGHLTLVPDGDLVLDPASQKVIINTTDKLYFDGGTDTYILESSDDVLEFYAGGEKVLRLEEGVANAVRAESADITIDATHKLFFDGTAAGHTYITQSSDDVLDIYVGGDTIMQLSEKGHDGNEISFGSSCVGFTQLEPTYDATDTLVDFRHSNKQFVTFIGGSITNLKLTFPLVSGNFVLLVKQDGTGSRTITNYKAMEFDESSADGSAGVVWAGGLAEGGPSGSSSGPNLTDDANHVDILSFYWDADNEIAYGVATLDFQF